MKLSVLLQFFITIIITLVGYATFAAPHKQAYSNMLAYDDIDFPNSELDKSLIPMIEDVFGKKLKNYKILNAREFGGEAYSGPDYVSPAFRHAKEYITRTETTLNFEDGGNANIWFTIDKLYIWNPVSDQVIEDSVVFQFPSPHDPFNEINIIARYDFLNEKLYYQTANETQIISCKSGPKDDITGRIAISKAPEQPGYLVTFDRDESMPQLEQNCLSVDVDKIKCVNQTSEILLEIYRPVAPLIEKFIITTKYFNVDGTLLKSEQTERVCE